MLLWHAISGLEAAEMDLAGAGSLLLSLSYFYFAALIILMTATPSVNSHFA